MTGKTSDIDFSLANIWQTWSAFRADKKGSAAIVEFEYQLEGNLWQLQAELANGAYQHGLYAHKIVNEQKRRNIAVAKVRDRVVHRLLYDYLVPIWDKTFIYDAWSCRRGKGLHGAINRTQSFMKSYQGGWVWRTDVAKFFDSVDQNTLRQLLRRRIIDPATLRLLDEVIGSYDVLASKQASKQASKAYRLAI